MLVFGGYHTLAVWLVCGMVHSLPQKGNLKPPPSLALHIKSVEFITIPSTASPCQSSDNGSIVCDEIERFKVVSQKPENECNKLNHLVTFSIIHNTRQ